MDHDKLNNHKILIEPVENGYIVRFQRYEKGDNGTVSAFVASCVADVMTVITAYLDGDVLEDEMKRDAAKEGSQ